MIVEDGDIAAGAAALLVPVTFHQDDVGAGITDAIQGSFKPGFAFEIVGVQTFQASSSGASVDVKIGTTSALSAAHSLGTGAARADATLNGTGANKRGDKDAVIHLHVTTAATTGVIADLTVWVMVRPQACRR